MVLQINKIQGANLPKLNNTIDIISCWFGRGILLYLFDYCALIKFNGNQI